MCSEHVSLWLSNYSLVLAGNHSTPLTKQDTSTYLMVLSLIDWDHIMDLAGRKNIYFQELKIYLFCLCKTSQSIKKYQWKVSMFCEQEEPILTSELYRIFLRISNSWFKKKRFDSSQSRNRTGVSYITGRFFTSWAPREAPDNRIPAELSAPLWWSAISI